jgi:hypothetical protein
MSTYQTSFFDQLSRSIMTQILSRLEDALQDYKNDDGETVTVEKLAEFLQMEVPKPGRAPVQTLPKPTATASTSSRAKKNFSPLPEITGRCGRQCTRGKKAGSTCDEPCDPGQHFCKTCLKLKSVQSILEHYGVDATVPEKSEAAPSSRRAAAKPELAPPPSSRAVAKPKEEPKEDEDDEAEPSTSASTRFGAKLASKNLDLSGKMKKTEVVDLLDDDESDDEDDEPEEEVKPASKPSFRRR